MSYLAYKTKLKLNNQQKTLMRQHRDWICFLARSIPRGQCAGYGRWVWNWALDFKQKAYDAGFKLNKSQLTFRGLGELSPTL